MSDQRIVYCSHTAATVSQIEEGGGSGDILDGNDSDFVPSDQSLGDQSDDEVYYEIGKQRRRSSTTASKRRRKSIAGIPSASTTVVGAGGGSSRRFSTGSLTVGGNSSSVSPTGGAPASSSSTSSFANSSTDLGKLERIVDREIIHMTEFLSVGGGGDMNNNDQHDLNEQAPTTPFGSSASRPLRPDHLRNQKFQQTCFAIQKIVQQKLYKLSDHGSSSIQAYFRHHFQISRAQVYRFVDCATVLEWLTEGVQQQDTVRMKLPNKERLCRELKKLAKVKSR